MKITSRYKIKSETMIALAREGYSNEFLREKERLFLEWAHKRDLDSPDAIFGERVRQHNPDTKKDDVTASNGSETLKQMRKPDVDAVTLERMEAIITMNKPHHNRNESSFYQWYDAQKKLLKEKVK